MSEHKTRSVQDPVSLAWFELCECEYHYGRDGYVVELVIDGAKEGCPHYE